MEDQHEHGPQPLDALMESWNLTNHQVVDASTEQLNHKQVQKARKGRRLTLTSMQKVCRAFNIAIWNRLNTEQKGTYFEYMHRHLFSYAKGHEPDWVDPNVYMFPRKG